MSRDENQAFDGFVVSLGALDDFTTRAENVRQRYHETTSLLHEADISDPAKKDALLSHPGFSEGGPHDFYVATKTLIDNYAKWVNKISQVHTATAGRLDYMVQQLAATHELYAGLDSQHANVFNRILGSSAPDNRGEDHGTA